MTESSFHVENIDDSTPAEKMLGAELDSLRAENERLRAAIRWALGEAADTDGVWFGDNRGSESEKLCRASYWWRTHLRKLAALEQSTAGKNNAKR